METKNMNKYGSVRDSFIIVILAIACLVALFTFITKNADDAGVSIPANYTTDYNNLIAQQTKLDSQLNEIQDAAQNVTESQLGDYAFFGLKGIWALMRLPLKFINVATNSLSLSLNFVPAIPQEIKTAIELGIVVLLLFSIIAFMTSRGKEP